MLDILNVIQYKKLDLCLDTPASFVFIIFRKTNTEASHHLQCPLQILDVGVFSLLFSNFKEDKYFEVDPLYEYFKEVPQAGLILILFLTS